MRAGSNGRGGLMKKEECVAIISDTHDETDHFEKFLEWVELIRQEIPLSCIIHAGDIGVRVLERMLGFCSDHDITPVIVASRYESYPCIDLNQEEFLTIGGRSIYVIHGDDPYRFYNNRFRADCIVHGHAHFRMVRTRPMNGKDTLILAPGSLKNELLNGELYPPEFLLFYPLSGRVDVIVLESDCD
jgi:predicted phosphodiesterase